MPDDCERAVAVPGASWLATASFPSQLYRMSIDHRCSAIVEVMMETPSLAQVRRVLERTLIVTGGELTAAMWDQISALRAVSGPVTMLELDVPSEVQKIDHANGPYRSMSNDAQVQVVDESGDATGGILLWVEDGRLITLEYYWYTDDPPLELPTVDRIVCATSR